MYIYSLDLVSAYLDPPRSLEHCIIGICIGIGSSSPSPSPSCCVGSVTTTTVIIGAGMNSLGYDIAEVTNKQLILN